MRCNFNEQFEIFGKEKTEVEERKFEEKTIDNFVEA